MICGYYGLTHCYSSAHWYCSVCAVIAEVIWKADGRGERLFTLSLWTLIAASTLALAAGFHISADFPFIH